MNGDSERRAVISVVGGRSLQDAIELDFSLLDGKMLVLQFRPSTLEDLGSQISQALAHHQRQTPGTHDHREVRALRAEAVAVVAAAGGEALILSITDEIGTAHHFAIDPDTSAALRPKLRQAEESARQQRSGRKQ